MSLGASFLLIAVGAILAFAVDVDVAGIDIEIVGWVLLGVGIFGLILSIFLMSSGRGPRRGEPRDPYGGPPL